MPTRPVANWSIFVLPIRIAPASRSFLTTSASASDWYEKSGQPAVVGSSKVSMLSFTAKGMP